MDERWVGRGLAAAGLVLCVSTWLWVEDRTDDDFRWKVGRHVELVGRTPWRLCDRVPIPEWPQPGTDEVRFRSRQGWYYSGDWAWERTALSWGDMRKYDDQRVAMCRPPVEVAQ